jgi:hypothetical protein
MAVLRHRFNTAPVRNTAAWRRADPGEGGPARRLTISSVTKPSPHAARRAHPLENDAFPRASCPGRPSTPRRAAKGGCRVLYNSTNMLAGASLLAQPLSVAGDSRPGRGGEGRRLRGKRERRRPACPLCGRVNRQPGWPCARQAGSKALPVVGLGLHAARCLEKHDPRYSSGRDL